MDFYRVTLCWCSVCCRHVSVCPSQAGIVSERLDNLSWCLSWRLPSTYPTLYSKEIRIPLKNKGTSLWNVAPIVILPQQVDCVVNKTRRRWSLLTTPMRQSTTGGCLLHVSQLSTDTWRVARSLGDSWAFVNTYMRIHRVKWRHVIYGHDTWSPFCGYNRVQCVELRGEDFVCYSNKIESVGLRRCPYDH